MSFIYVSFFNVLGNQNTKKEKAIKKFMISFIYHFAFPNYNVNFKLKLRISSYTLELLIGTT